MQNMYLIGLNSYLYAKFLFVCKYNFSFIYIKNILLSQCYNFFLFVSKSKSLIKIKKLDHQIIGTLHTIVFQIKILVKRPVRFSKPDRSDRFDLSEIL